MRRQFDRFSQENAKRALLAQNSRGVPPHPPVSTQDATAASQQSPPAHPSPTAQTHPNSVHQAPIAQLQSATTKTSGHQASSVLDGPSNTRAMASGSIFTGGATQSSRKTTLRGLSGLNSLPQASSQVKKQGSCLIVAHDGASSVPLLHSTVQGTHPPHTATPTQTSTITPQGEVAQSSYSVSTTSLQTTGHTAYPDTTIHTHTRISGGASANASILTNAAETNSPPLASSSFPLSSPRMASPHSASPHAASGLRTSARSLNTYAYTPSSLSSPTSLSGNSAFSQPPRSAAFSGGVRRMPGASSTATAPPQPLVFKQPDTNLAATAVTPTVTPGEIPLPVPTAPETRTDAISSASAENTSYARGMSAAPSASAASPFPSPPDPSLPVSIGMGVHADASMGESNSIDTSSNAQSGGTGSNVSVGVGGVAGMLRNEGKGDALRRQMIARTGMAGRFGKMGFPGPGNNRLSGMSRDSGLMMKSNANLESNSMPRTTVPPRPSGAQIDTDAATDVSIAPGTGSEDYDAAGAGAGAGARPPAPRAHTTDGVKGGVDAASVRDVGAGDVVVGTQQVGVSAAIRGSDTSRDRAGEGEGEAEGEVEDTAGNIEGNAEENSENTKIPGEKDAGNADNPSAIPSTAVGLRALGKASMLGKSSLLSKSGFGLSAATTPAAPTVKKTSLLDKLGSIKTTDIHSGIALVMSKGPRARGDGKTDKSSGKNIAESGKGKKDGGKGSSEEKKDDEGAEDSYKVEEEVKYSTVLTPALDEQLVSKIKEKMLQLSNKTHTGPSVATAAREAEDSIGILGVTQREKRRLFRKFGRNFRFSGVSGRMHARADECVQVSERSGFRGPLSISCDGNVVVVGPQLRLYRITRDAVGVWENSDAQEREERYGALANKDEEEEEETSDQDGSEDEKQMNRNYGPWQEDERAVPASTTSSRRSSVTSVGSYMRSASTVANSGTAGYTSAYNRTQSGFSSGISSLSTRSKPNFVKGHRSRSRKQRTRALSAFFGSQAIQPSESVDMDLPLLSDDTDSDVDEFSDEYTREDEDEEEMSARALRREESVSSITSRDLSSVLHRTSSEAGSSGYHSSLPRGDTSACGNVPSGPSSPAVSAQRNGSFLDLSRKNETSRNLRVDSESEREVLDDRVPPRSKADRSYGDNDAHHWSLHRLSSLRALGQLPDTISISADAEPSTLASITGSLDSPVPYSAYTSAGVADEVRKEGFSGRDAVYQSVGTQRLLQTSTLQRQFSASTQRSGNTPSHTLTHTSAHAHMQAQAPSRPHPHVPSRRSQDGSDGYARTHREHGHSNNGDTPVRGRGGGVNTRGTYIGKTHPDLPEAFSRIPAVKHDLATSAAAAFSPLLTHTMACDKKWDKRMELALVNVEADVTVSSLRLLTEKPVSQLLWHPQDANLLSLVHHRSCMITDTRVPRVLLTLANASSNAMPRSMSFHPADPYKLLLCGDQETALFDIRNPLFPLFTLDSGTKQQTIAMFHPQDGRCIAAFAGSTCRLWTAPSGSEYLPVSYPLLRTPAQALWRPHSADMLVTHPRSRVISVCNPLAPTFTCGTFRLPQAVSSFALHNARLVVVGDGATMSLHHVDHYEAVRVPRTPIAVAPQGVVAWARREDTYTPHSFISESGKLPMDEIFREFFSQSEIDRESILGGADVDMDSLSTRMAGTLSMHAPSQSSLLSLAVPSSSPLHMVHPYNATDASFNAEVNAYDTIAQGGGLGNLTTTETATYDLLTTSLAPLSSSTVILRQQLLQCMQRPNGADGDRAGTSDGAEYGGEGLDGAVRAADGEMEDQGKYDDVAGGVGHRRRLEGFHSKTDGRDRRTEVQELDAWKSAEHGKKSVFVSVDRDHMSSMLPVHLPPLAITIATSTPATTITTLASPRDITRATDPYHHATDPYHHLSNPYHTLNRLPALTTDASPRYGPHTPATTTAIRGTFPHTHASTHTTAHSGAYTSTHTSVHAFPHTGTHTAAHALTHGVSDNADIRLPTPHTQPHQQQQPQQNLSFSAAVPSALPSTAQPTVHPSTQTSEPPILPATVPTTMPQAAMHVTTTTTAAGIASGNAVPVGTSAVVPTAIATTAASDALVTAAMSVPGNMVGNVIPDSTAGAPPSHTILSFASPPHPSAPLSPPYQLSPPLASLPISSPPVASSSTLVSQPHTSPLFTPAATHATLANPHTPMITPTPIHAQAAGDAPPYTPAYSHAHTQPLYSAQPLSTATRPLLGDLHPLQSVVPSLSNTLPLSTAAPLPSPESLGSVPTLHIPTHLTTTPATMLTTTAPATTATTTAVTAATAASIVPTPSAPWAAVAAVTPADANAQGHSRSLVHAAGVNVADALAAMLSCAASVASRSPASTPATMPLSTLGAVPAVSLPPSMQSTALHSVIQSSYTQSLYSHHALPHTHAHAYIQAQGHTAHSQQVFAPQSTPHPHAYLHASLPPSLSPLQQSPPHAHSPPALPPQESSSIVAAAASSSTGIGASADASVMRMETPAGVGTWSQHMSSPYSTPAPSTSANPEKSTIVGTIQNPENSRTSLNSSSSFPAAPWSGPRHNTYAVYAHPPPVPAARAYPHTTPAPQPAAVVHAGANARVDTQASADVNAKVDAKVHAGTHGRVEVASAAATMAPANPNAPTGISAEGATSTAPVLVPSALANAANASTARTLAIDANMLAADNVTMRSASYVGPAHASAAAVGISPTAIAGALVTGASTTGAPMTGVPMALDGTTAAAAPALSSTDAGMHERTLQTNAGVGGVLVPGPTTTAPTYVFATASTSVSDATVASAMAAVPTISTVTEVAIGAEGSVAPGPVAETVAITVAHAPSTATLLSPLTPPSASLSPPSSTSPTTTSPSATTARVSRTLSALSDAPNASEHAPTQTHSQEHTRVQAYTHTPAQTPAPSTPFSPPTATPSSSLPTAMPSPTTPVCSPNSSLISYADTPLSPDTVASGLLSSYPSMVISSAAVSVSPLSSTGMSSAPSATFPDFPLPMYAAPEAAQPQSPLNTLDTSVMATGTVSDNFPEPQPSTMEAMPVASTPRAFPTVADTPSDANNAQAYPILHTLHATQDAQVLQGLPTSSGIHIDAAGATLTLVHPAPALALADAAATHTTTTFPDASHAQQQHELLHSSSHIASQPLPHTHANTLSADPTSRGPAPPLAHTSALVALPVPLPAPGSTPMPARVLTPATMPSRAVDHNTLSSPALSPASSAQPITLQPSQPSQLMAHTHTHAHMQANVFAQPQEHSRGQESIPPLALVPPPQSPPGIHHAHTHAHAQPHSVLSPLSQPSPFPSCSPAPATHTHTPAFLPSPSLPTSPQSLQPSLISHAHAHPNTVAPSPLAIPVPATTPVSPPVPGPMSWLPHTSIPLSPPTHTPHTPKNPRTPTPGRSNEPALGPLDAGAANLSSPTPATYYGVPTPHYLATSSGYPATQLPYTETFQHYPASAHTYPPDAQPQAATTVYRDAAGHYSTDPPTAVTSPSAAGPLSVSGSEAVSSSALVSATAPGPSIPLVGGVGGSLPPAADTYTHAPAHAPAHMTTEAAATKVGTTASSAAATSSVVPAHIVHPDALSWTSMHSYAPHTTHAPAPAHAPYLPSHTQPPQQPQSHNTTITTTTTTINKSRGGDSGAVKPNDDSVPRGSVYEDSGSMSGDFTGSYPHTHTLRSDASITSLTSPDSISGAPSEAYTPTIRTIATTIGTTAPTIATTGSTICTMGTLAVDMEDHGPTCRSSLAWLTPQTAKSTVHTAWLVPAINASGNKHISRHASIPGMYKFPQPHFSGIPVSNLPAGCISARNDLDSFISQYIFTSQHVSTIRNMQFPKNIPNSIFPASHPSSPHATEGLTLGLSPLHRMVLYAEALAYSPQHPALATNALSLSAGSPSASMLSTQQPPLALHSATHGFTQAPAVAPTYTPLPGSTSDSASGSTYGTVAGPVHGPPSPLPPVLQHDILASLIAGHGVPPALLHPLTAPLPLVPLSLLAAQSPLLHRCVAFLRLCLYNRAATRLLEGGGRGQWLCTLWTLLALAVLHHWIRTTQNVVQAVRLAQARCGCNSPHARLRAQLTKAHQEHLHASHAASATSATSTSANVGGTTAALASTTSASGPATGHLYGRAVSWPPQSEHCFLCLVDTDIGTPHTLANMLVADIFADYMSMPRTNTATASARAHHAAGMSVRGHASTYSPSHSPSSLPSSFFDAPSPYRVPSPFPALFGERKDALCQVLARPTAIHTQAIRPIAGHVHVAQHNTAQLKDSSIKAGGYLGMDLLGLISGNTSPRLGCSQPPVEIPAHLQNMLVSMQLAFPDGDSSTASHTAHTSSALRSCLPTSPAYSALSLPVPPPLPCSVTDNLTRMARAVVAASPYTHACTTATSTGTSGSFAGSSGGEQGHKLVFSDVRWCIHWVVTTAIANAEISSAVVLLSSITTCFAKQSYLALSSATAKKASQPVHVPPQALQDPLFFGTGASVAPDAVPMACAIGLDPPPPLMPSHGMFSAQRSMYARLRRHYLLLANRDPLRAPQPVACTTPAYTAAVRTVRGVRAALGLLDERYSPAVDNASARGTDPCTGAQFVLRAGRSDSNIVVPASHRSLACNADAVASDAGVSAPLSVSSVTSTLTPKVLIPPLAPVSVYFRECLGAYLRPFDLLDDPFIRKESSPALVTWALVVPERSRLEVSHACVTLLRRCGRHVLATALLRACGVPYLLETNKKGVSVAASAAWERPKMGVYASTPKPPHAPAPPGVASQAAVKGNTGKGEMAVEPALAEEDWSPSAILIHICSLDIDYLHAPKGPLLLNKDPMADDSVAAQSTEPVKPGLFTGLCDDSEHQTFDDLGMSDVTICALCTRTVAGIVALCNKCGHGGCLPHMNEWFAEFGTCPAGCGCDCVIANK